MRGERERRFGVDGWGEVEEGGEGKGRVLVLGRWRGLEEENSHKQKH